MPSPYKSRTSDFKHQKQIGARSRAEEYFALLMEMGTGKSKLVVDTAGHLHAAGEIDDLVVVCPNGLQRNWRTQFETHYGGDYRFGLFEGQIRAAERDNTWDILQRPDSRLRVIAINVDGFRGESGEEVLDAFFCLDKRGRPPPKLRRVMMAVDESQRIKNKGSQQTKGVMRYANFTSHRRIASGTSSPNSPVDLFSQFNFLEPGILGFESFVEFRAHFCELLPDNHPMVRGIAAKMGPSAKYKMPPIQVRDSEGRPIYKNLGELNQLIAPFTARARKEDCLDLPPKLYKRKTIQLSKAQRAIYNEVKKNIIAEFVHDGRLYMIDSKIAIARLTRLAQVAGNHFPDERRDSVRIETQNNPRLEALKEIVEDAGDWAQGIVWCRHKAEITEVEQYLKTMGGCTRLDGEVSPEDRDTRIKDFQAGRVQYVAAQVAIGVGFDAFAARFVVYYTNDFSLEHRLQSEDRAHRQGLTHPVTYWDIEALDTLDSKIITALRDKREISDVIAGEPIVKWI